MNGHSNSNNNTANSPALQKDENQQMQSQILEFIEACNLMNDSNDANRQRGHKYLLEIKKRSNPYEFCLKILSISSESHVQFQALRTICDAFLNEWYNLPIDYVERLREELLLFPVNYKKGKLSGYVLNQIAKCVSIMYKRKWKVSGQDLHSADKEKDIDAWNRAHICNKILTHIEKLLSSNDPSVAIIGLTFCNELIEEFSVNHASSALGLTWDFHIKCHRGFEQFCLQALFINICKLFKKIVDDMVLIHEHGNGYVIKAESKILSALQIQASTKGHVVGKSVQEMLNMTAVVLEKCLSFHFHEKTSDDTLLLAFTRTSSFTQNNQMLRPGPAWKQCLIDSNLLLLLNVFHNLLYTKCNEHRQFNSTIRLLRESIINMHSLTGHIFDTPPISADSNLAASDSNGMPSDEEDNEGTHKRKIRFKLSPRSSAATKRLKGMELALYRTPYLKNCILYFRKYTWSLIKMHEQQQKRLDDELLLDVCRMYQTLCNNFRYELLASITEFASNDYYFFQGLRDLGNLLIAHIPADINNIDTWSNEGFDILIQSVVSIITCYELRSSSLKKQSVAILQIFASMTQQIYMNFIEKMLSNAEIEMKENESNSEEMTGSSQFNDAQYINERLLGMATIGRINGCSVLPYLSQKIQSYVSEIKQFKMNALKFMQQNPQQPGAPMAEIPAQQKLHLNILHEKLFWLFQFLGYTLADDPSTQNTTIPNIFFVCNTNINSTTNDLLVSAVYPLFEWIEFENECIVQYVDNAQSMMIQLISPLLAQTVITMLSRWAASYLMPNVAYYTQINLSLLKSFSEQQAAKTLDMIVHKCYINIFKWREERDVVYETCKMLESFIKHSSIRPHLFKSESYNKYILSKYYSNALDLYSLPNELIPILIQIILQSVIGAPGENVNIRLSAFNKICLPIYEEFKVQCAPFVDHSKSFHTSEQFNRLQLSICKLHGISKTSTDFTFDFMLKNGIFAILIEIIPRFSNHFDHDIVLTIFYIFADIAERSLYDLDKTQSKIFLKLCVKLIEQFEQHNLIRLKQINSDYIAAKTREKYEEMQIAEIMVILKLLEFMSTKDLIDINLSTQSGESEELTELLCGQCIFKSFYYLTPNITKTLLQYETLGNRFYEVLSICIRGFTSTFALKLNNEQRNTILGDKVLKSLSSAQSQIMEYGLEIVECFAEYHINEASFHSPFLPYLQDSIHQLFMLLIDIRTPKALYPKLCETLLPVLIAMGKDKILQYLSSFINNICQNGQQQQQKLANKFTELINKLNEVPTPPLDMRTRLKFRDYFISLTHDIRSIVSVH